MKYLLGALIAVFIFYSTASAQTLAPDLSIEAIPSNPQPGQSVRLIVRSYGADITQAELAWVYNGTSVARGIGETTVQVVAPAAGKTGTVTVTASGFGIQTTSASITLRPGSIDLLWEAADAYTPPFYKGKALLPVGGTLRVTAVPASAAKNISFNWQRNGSALQDISGYGKSSITLRHNAFNPQENISVSAAGAGYSGTNSLRLSPYAPLARIYENRDGFIDYTKGFADTISLSSKGAVIHIEPFYFSIPNNPLQDLLFSIKIGGQTVVPSQQNEIAVSRPENSDQGSMELGITTLTYSLQHLEKTFSFLFK